MATAPVRPPTPVPAKNPPIAAPTAQRPGTLVSGANTAKTAPPAPAAKTAPVAPPAPAAKTAPAPPAPANSTEDVEDVGEIGEGSRQPHPLVGSADPAIYPFAEVPEDFDPKIHRRLKKVDFRDEIVYFTHQLDIEHRRHARKVQLIEESIADCKAGTSGAGMSLRRMQKMASKTIAMAIALVKQGKITKEELTSLGLVFDENENVSIPGASAAE